MALTFARPRLMRWAGNAVTDHNRSELSIDVERIEKANRMANGTRRSYIVADKRSFSCSWDMLPHKAQFTVDGYWGGSEIENFYNTNTGAFVLELTSGDGTVSTYNVVMTDFSKDIKKRGKYDFWQVSVKMEEV